MAPHDQQHSSVPGGRKQLCDMTSQELQAWLLEQQAELEDFCSYAQAWTKRRARSGRQTYHDQRYSQFFERAADLIAGLDELRQIAAEAAAQGNDS